MVFIIMCQCVETTMVVFIKEKGQQIEPKTVTTSNNNRKKNISTGIKTSFMRFTNA